jgi:hypothetical protein
MHHDNFGHRHIATEDPTNRNAKPDPVPFPGVIGTAVVRTALDLLRVKSEVLLWFGPMNQDPETLN